MITASIVGATGYTGAVLTDILAEHPEVRLGPSRPSPTSGQRVDQVFPHLRVDGSYVPYSPESAGEADVAFVCYPHAEAYAVVAELVDKGCRVVDLSADYRLKDPAGYEQWYGFTHPRTDLVAEAVFGLPEVYRKAISTARIVANPGCYPTSMILGLLPAVGEIDAGRGDSRLQVRGLRRGTHSLRQDALLRRGRQLQGLQRSGPPAYRRDGAGTGCRGRRAVAGLVHAASPAGRPGHPQHDLLPAQERAARYRGLAGDIPDLL